MSLHSEFQQQQFKTVRDSERWCIIEIANCKFPHCVINIIQYICFIQMTQMFILWSLVCLLGLFSQTSERCQDGDKATWEPGSWKRRRRRRKKWRRLWSQSADTSWWRCLINYKPYCFLDCSQKNSHVLTQF